MKKIITAILSGVLISSSFASEITHDNSQDWYAVPSASYIKTDQSRGTDDKGINYNFEIGKKLGNRLNLEFGYNKNQIDLVNSNSTLDQDALELDALFFFSRNNAFSPYLLTGTGIVKTDNTDDTNPTWAGGLGFLSDFNVITNAKIRAEARFQQEVDTSELAHDDVLIRVGLQIPFGASAPAPKITPKDGDGDGVNDDADRCPATPAGATVNDFGCELDSDTDGVVDSKDDCPDTSTGTVVDSRGCEISADDDGDGVNNTADQCPNTPFGTVVNVYGCAIDGDDDGDGVLNSVDQCPNSTLGVRIDYKGCEIKDVISLPGIRFETNSSQLARGSLAILNSAAETLNKYPDIRAEVAGHSDSSGEAKYNQWLSARRADSVRKYLIGRGVAESRLSSQGYGESQPIADNNTAAGRTANRRVDLNVQQ